MKITLKHYDEDFAKAVIDAMFKGKKTIVFEHTRYTISGIADKVLDDLKTSFHDVMKKSIGSFSMRKNLYQVNWHYKGDKPEDGWIEELMAFSKKDLKQRIAEEHQVDSKDIVIVDSWILE